MKLFENDKTDFALLYGRHTEEILVPYIKHISRLLLHDYGVHLPAVDDWGFYKYPEEEMYAGKAKHRLIIGSEESETCRALTASLAPDSYAMRVSGGNVYIAYTSLFAALYALDRFEKEYCLPDAEIPDDLDVSEHVDIHDYMITTKISNVRDPYVLIKDGVHYMYGTTWQYWVNRDASVRSNDWSGPYEMVDVPEDAPKTFFHWAPEVYLYRGAYYLFTAYMSEKTGKRGVTVMRADKPEGPFREISDGFVTPKDQDCIDGTLYVDENGQPWMFYVHEWTCTDDGIGRMDVVKMADDLTRFAGEPVELFRADDPAYCVSQVTDGPEMFKTKDGQLLMLWASSDSAGYFEAVIRSKTGSPLGPWVFEQELYSRKFSNEYDGGHGMLFYDNDGQLYLTLHGPNHKQGEVQEIPRFFPMRESAGTVVWDLYRK